MAIMAHHKRGEFVLDLQRALDRHATVIWDRRDDRWDTGSRALLAYSKRAEYHLVLQDDAIVCRDLAAGVESALDHLASRTGSPTPMSLYVGTWFRREQQFFNGRSSWLVMPLYWGVGIVLPTRYIEQIVAWGNKHPEIDNYDIRIQQWLHQAGMQVWYPWPSLIDHRLSPSLVPGRGMNGRHALNFIGQDVSALDFDVTGAAFQRPDRFKTTTQIRKRWAAGAAL